MWCIDEYIMANIQNNLDFITAIEQEIHIWASSLFLCGLKREYQKPKKKDSPLHMHIQKLYSRIQNSCLCCFSFNLVFFLYTFYMIWELLRDLCCLPPFAFIDIFTFNATNPSVGIQLFWCAIQHIVDCARTCALYACVCVCVCASVWIVCDVP